MSLRDAIDDHPLLRHYMRCLTTAELIARRIRPAAIDHPLRSGLTKMLRAWSLDEFVLDPCRVTVFIGATGIDGDTEKRLYLASGPARASRCPDQPHRCRCPTSARSMMPSAKATHRRRRKVTCGGRSTSRMTTACANYVLHDELSHRVRAGASVVSASFVTPYPPGFPVLVPGQVVSAEVLSFIDSLDVKEIHGYRPNLGYRVFTDQGPQSSGGTRTGDDLRGRSRRRSRGAHAVGRKGPQRSAMTVSVTASMPASLAASSSLKP